MRGRVWIFIKKKQHRVWRYPSNKLAPVKRLDDLPTLDTVDFDPLADVHHLDKRPFIGGDGVVHCGLVSDTFPVVRHCLFGIPSGVLNTCCQRVTCDTE